MIPNDNTKQRNYTIAEEDSSGGQVSYQSQNVTVQHRDIFGNESNYTVPVQVPNGRTVTSVSSDNIGGAHITFDNGTSAYVRRNNTWGGYNSATGGSQFTQTNSDGEYVQEKVNTPLGQVIRVRQATEAEKVEYNRRLEKFDMDKYFNDYRNAVKDARQRNADGWIDYHPSIYSSALSTLSSATSSIASLSSSLGSITSAISAAQSSIEGSLDEDVKAKVNINLSSSGVQTAMNSVSSSLTTAQNKLNGILSNLRAYKVRYDNTYAEASAGNDRMQSTVYRGANGSFSAETIVLANDGKGNKPENWKEISSSTLSFAQSSKSKDPEYSFNRRLQSNLVMGFTAATEGIGEAGETIMDFGATVGGFYVAVKAAEIDFLNGDTNLTTAQKIGSAVSNFVKTSYVDDHFSSITTDKRFSTSNANYFANDSMKRGGVLYDGIKEVSKDATMYAIGIGASKVGKAIKGAHMASSESTLATAQEKAINSYDDYLEIKEAAKDVLHNKNTLSKAKKAGEKVYDIATDYNSNMEAYASNSSLSSERNKELTARAITGAVIGNFLPDTVGDIAMKHTPLKNVNKTIDNGVKKIDKFVGIDEGGHIAKFAKSEIKDNTYGSVASDTKSAIKESVNQIPGSLSPELADGSLTDLVGVENPDVDFTSPTDVIANTIDTATETGKEIATNVTNPDSGNSNNGSSNSNAGLSTGAVSGASNFSATSASTTPEDTPTSANYSAPENMTTSAPAVTISK